MLRQDQPPLEAEEDLLELRRQMQSRDSQIALDLEDVTLVTRPQSAFWWTASREE